MSKKDKLLKLIKKELSPNKSNLLKAFQIVEQRDSVVFRVPAQLNTIDDIWIEVKAIADKNKISVIRADLYATVAELKNILTDIEWLWKGSIPRGFMTMIAGEPGIGKSLLVLDLIKIITEGSCYPNSQEKAQKGSALWIDTEMKQQLLLSRVESMKIDQSKIFIPSIGGNLLTKFDASNPEHIQHILGLIDYNRPDIMVVDSLGHSHSKGENRIEEVRPVMDTLTAIARDYNMGMIVVHHLNKGRENEAAEISLSRVRGSTDIVATPVVIFSLEKGVSPDTIKVRQIKNNIGKPLGDLTAQLTYHDEAKEEIKALSYTVYTPPPPKRTKKDICSDWVKTKLEKSKDGMPLQELISEGEGQGFTRNNIYAAREILGDQLTFTGTGKLSIWHLTTSMVDEDAVQKFRGKKEKKK